MKQFLTILFCGYFCQLSGINLRNLKDTACQITYKAIYQDLKERLHRKERVISAEYKEQIAEFMKACVPGDPGLDRIERNQAPVEVNWL